MAQLKPHSPAKKKPFNYRLLTLIIAAILGVVLSIPSFFQGGNQFKDMPKITLGLDLQGGLSLLLNVDTKAAIKSKYTSMASAINFQTKDKNVLISGLKTTNNSLTFNILDSSESKKVDSILSDIQGIVVKKNANSYAITLSDEERLKTAKSALDQAIATIRNRLDKFGLSEPSVSRQGEDQILVEMPGIKTNAEQQRLIDLISRSAKLELMAVDEDRNPRVAQMSEAEATSYGDTILPYSDQSQAKLLVKAIPIIDGSMLTDAQAMIGHDSGSPVVSFQLNSVGAKIFADFSANNIKKRMAIVLDGKVFSAPVIQERIGGGTGQISGGFTMQQASDLAITLRSGALAAPVSVVEKRSVGPSLGADSIRASFIALVAGFVLVVIFMLAYYSMAGVFACIALIVNLFLIIAVMAIFGATLTLPGMAGIVLTVGMAVDANIIINERIREALKEGLGVINSIKTGYANASRAIFDANVTSLIASLLLYIYGTGAIKGFAITTGIGILASIITAIIGTHGIYLWLGEKMARSHRTYFWFGITLHPESSQKDETKNELTKQNKKDLKVAHGNL
ncbi:protein translocase subunit SecD [Helicobacter sp. 11S02629-2]|uniref:protein translocase subunit SecD n=1 Tax=Helicobacter sp. 11S02629-2 TaxID=1476195 RepID=UPI000BA62009|nr:protein translocase subunit SecD [Helicobacter sp. 11S02629-2]PAF45474.1 protein-export membrane protein SecD [Helicobacter sp. 11S02629-2]